MQERAKKTRAKLLKTSTKLFARYGLNGVTVDTIAEKAGANKQRIYAYFGNKEKLFEACLADVFEKINKKDEVLETLSDDDIPDLTGILLRHYFGIHQNNPDFRRLISWANLETTTALEAIYDVKQSSLSHLRKLYAKGCAKGVFDKKVSFETYMFALFALSFFYYSNRKTLENTLGSALFDEQGTKRLIQEAIVLLGK